MFMPVDTGGGGSVNLTQCLGRARNGTQICMNENRFEKRKYSENQCLQLMQIDIFMRQGWLLL